MLIVKHDSSTVESSELVAPWKQSGRKDSRFALCGLQRKSSKHRHEWPKETLHIGDRLELDRVIDSSKETHMPGICNLKCFSVV